MNATASSQTGCSGWAPAPELSPYGAPAAATSPPAFMNKPPRFPQLLPNSFFAELDAHNSFNDIEAALYLPENSTDQMAPSRQSTGPAATR